MNYHPEDAPGETDSFLEPFLPEAEACWQEIREDAAMAEADNDTLADNLS